ncbi:polysaccharide deacetylase family protein [Microcoleus vaginatus PCC 9802]|uniref:polysaccharide deacetylase family protein n=1 Tax=Microcoleus vaginatus TaxID=119532 RepID=UPI00020D2969|nr:polysaccharide deacetylase [Microcoleus vaginatus FGP-2]UNU19873.1 polysaccharide deacetylase family protein [Microcoleus vaginatus PCC 9802]
MSRKGNKKRVIKTVILIGLSITISLLSENRKTANSNPLIPIAPVENPPPNLLKPPKLKTPPSLSATPSPKPPEQPLVFAPPAQFHSQIVYKASINNSKVIALTFDDGPSPETLKILEVLHKHQVVGTFFCLGANLREYPEIAKRVVQAGNAIGNHTWHHYSHNVTEKTASDEIDNTGIHIYRSTGAKSFLFRPPGGRLNNGLAAYAQKKNYVVVMWSIDPKDFLQPPAAAIALTVLSQATSGAIVLLHDGGGNRQQTVEALSAIIPKLKQQGYRFVTVPQLLQMQAGQKQRIADQKSP